MAANGKHLRTAGEVIDTIGISRAMKLAGVKAPTAPINWRTNDFLPATSFLAMTVELESKGFTADPTLWGMRQARAS